MLSSQRRQTSMIFLSLALLGAPACDEGDEGDELAGETGESGESGESGQGDGDAETSDESEGQETGELTGCAAIDSEVDCTNEAGCAPVLGQALVDDGHDGLCLEAEEQFVGCASSNELCPGTGKTLCDGESLWRTTGCVPGNVTACEAPAAISGACE